MKVLIQIDNQKKKISNSPTVSQNVTVKMALPQRNWNLSVLTLRIGNREGIQNAR